jgi:anti-sigma B factor antagonist
MQNEFSIRVVPCDDGQITVVELCGYLDAYTAPQFDELLAEFHQQGHVRVVVDCSELDYISSAGLGVFMGHIEQYRQSGGDIVLCGLSPRITGIVEMLGFPHIFGIYGTRQEALAAINQNLSSG